MMPLDEKDLQLLAEVLPNVSDRTDSQLIFFWIAE